MLNVQIEKLVFGGMGLARTVSGVVFVPGVLPGEVVMVSPDYKSGGVQVVRVHEIVQQSIDRRNPPCEYYGTCGGCDWLHINVKKQSELKQQIFEDCFKRIGGFEKIENVYFFDSPESNYRIRGQLKINSDGRAGFYKRQSNDVIPLSGCPLLTSSINQKFSDNYINFYKQGEKSIKMIDGDGAVASHPVIPGVTRSETVIKVNGRSFKVNGGDFFQSNRFLNPALGGWALPYIGGNHCVDLYGGCGFFSLMVAGHFKKGILIESVESQVRKANGNFVDNGITHFAARCSEAENLLSHCSQRPDLVIVDPPRTGLTSKVKHALVALKPQKILYVSCNVSTQARDSAFFVKNAGYTIDQCALFDCYPNTSHLESAILFMQKQ